MEFQIGEAIGIPNPEDNLNEAGLTAICGPRWPYSDLRGFDKR